MITTRRAFVRYLVATPLAGLAARLGRGVPVSKSYLLNEFFIAGLRYYEGLDLVDELRVGDTLTLAAEPDNLHDDFAVEIYRQAHKLGYVPRTDNRHISRLVRQGASLTCQVLSVCAEEEPWRMVKVQVLLMVW